MQELTWHLTGNTSVAYNIAAFLFVLFGAAISVLYDAQTRNVYNEDSPEQWSWRFFWRNNRWRFGLNLLLAIAIIRFFFDLTGIQINMFYCFLTGVVFDGLIVVYKKLRKRLSKIIDQYLDEF